MGEAIRASLTNWADLLTFSRLLLAFLIFFLALAGNGSPDLVLLIYLAAWTTDNLDGYLARKSGQEGRLANYDLPFDIFLITSGLAYLVSEGFYSPWVPLIYFLAAILLMFFDLKTPLMTLSFIAILLSYRALLRLDGRLAFYALIWALVIAIVNRKGLARQIRLYLAGFKRREEDET